MDGVSYAEALFGLVIASTLFWGAIFAFAYSRRQFGGSARPYLAGFAFASIATLAFFVLLTITESA